MSGYSNRRLSKALYRSILRWSNKAEVRMLGNPSYCGCARDYCTRTVTVRVDFLRWWPMQEVPFQLRFTDVQRCAPEVFERLDSLKKVWNDSQAVRDIAREAFRLKKVWNDWHAHVHHVIPSEVQQECAAHSWGTGYAPCLSRC